MKRHKFALLLFVFSPLANNSYGLDSDQAQAITIQADSAIFNATDNRAIYQGHVELMQGSLKMSADSLTIQNSRTGSVVSLTAVGKPASYTQQLTIDKPAIEATAEKVIYHPQEEKIELMNQAQIRQGENLFQGDQIKYDLKQRILSAVGNNNTGGKNKSSGRVKMVIPPTIKPKDTHESKTSTP